MLITKFIIYKPFAKINNLALKGKVCWYKKALSEVVALKTLFWRSKAKLLLIPKKGNQSLL